MSHTVIKANTITIGHVSNKTVGVLPSKVILACIGEDINDPEFKLDWIGEPLVIENYRGGNIAHHIKEHISSLDKTERSRIQCVVESLQGSSKIHYYNGGETPMARASIQLSKNHRQSLGSFA